MKMPDGTTGPGEHDMLYNMEITGPQGARYTLLKELQHTPKDIRKAKSYLRNNFDVVHIYIKEIE